MKRTSKNEGENLVKNLEKSLGNSNSRINILEGENKKLELENKKIQKELKEIYGILEKAKKTEEEYLRDSKINLDFKQTKEEETKQLQKKLIKSGEINRSLTDQNIKLKITGILTISSWMMIGIKKTRDLLSKKQIKIKSKKI
jgi:nitrogenase molybdenum-iron protein alpha/beta subunit